ncbi:NRAMP (natural resistance-associated macrophage protein) metal ion transporters [Chitinophaga costaii]|uniref:NRAMP (Natural resistance-associated macrophage protein) metal ion transporters n=1 Tax=Chitinophaga costaii TaxID=1335309 RepID=A0A1C4CW85_9BACT|nr:divalent metal cation transporter [Chitinophaga costaii]PUZ26919.1 divalent metal cation transporter [Chitinophaga costaii]SCC23293.1 NRAMP (natural resistance-associated macrophage protein) metal ion transporters [Chitinophaga costaii]
MKRSATLSSKIKSTLKILGPGLITGASDDDPSGIATYTQTGAQFGYTTLWTALITFPLMAAIQGMCARIGLVTSQGLTVTLRNHYSKPVLYLMLLFGFPAITLNIGADIQGMGAVANMLFPTIPVSVFSVLFTGMLMFIIILFPYQRIAAILKWLCISLLLYLIVPFMIKQNWALIARNTFIPTLHFNKDFLSILVAILGTTISPYLFFWQATMEAEDRKHSKKIMVDKQVLDDMRKDVNIGMLLSNVVMFFIILTAASVLFPAGIRQVDTVDQAAKALEPLVGRFAYLIFAVGVIGTGFLGIPVLAGSQAYMLAETFGWQAGLDEKFPQAKPFYISIILSLLVGLSLNFIGISPIQSLLYTAILYGLTAPVLIGIILHIGNNKKIMQDKTNSTLSNILGGLTFLIMTAAAVALLYFQFT